MEVQQPDESNPYEEVYKDSSTFLKVGKLIHMQFILLFFIMPSSFTNYIFVAY